MIATLLLTMLAPGAAPALGAIGRQQLPARGCAAFLWRTDGIAGAAGPVAMAVADPALLRVSIDGAPAIDLPRVATTGPSTSGLATGGDYRLNGLAATLVLTVVDRPDLRDGAAVPQATLRVVRDGGDELVTPLAGLIACRPGT